MSKVHAWDALPDLKKLGYSFKSARWINSVSSPVEYCSCRAMQYYVMDTPNGERKVKVHARTYASTARYWHGIAYLLFDEVDEFVLWHQDERKIYIVPAWFLKQKWIDCGRQHEKTQWVINLCAADDIVDKLQFSMSEYSRHIPNEN